MSIRENRYQVIDLIRPEHILISVFDKAGLVEVVRGILTASPEAKFYSTGGTGKKVIEILGSGAASHYCAVEDFTGAPEMEGGLVKTLHPKIHAGLLAERGNPAHEEYLYKTLARDSRYPGVYFDVFIGNLYPFTSVIAKEETTSETARVNIDIGGPAMTMAAAKNWHSVAVLTSPSQYAGFLAGMAQQDGKISLAQRFSLAQQAMQAIGEYRSAIGRYFSTLDFDKDVKTCLDLR